MKLYIPRLTVAFAAFAISVWAASLWLPEQTKPLLEDVIVSKAPIIAPLAAATPLQLQSKLEPLSKPKPKQLKSIPFNRHKSFYGVVDTLKRLAAFVGKKGVQTFYISNIRDEGDNEGEYAYAYWKQDNSIIILDSPQDLEPSDSQLWWLSSKARIDLKNIVPSEEYNKSLGCCLVEKDWADEILGRCKAGYKLQVIGYGKQVLNNVAPSKSLKRRRK